MCVQRYSVTLANEPTECQRNMVVDVYIQSKARERKGVNSGKFREGGNLEEKLD